ncbi:hypothetical protein, partial [Ralstonia pseudosolanacearum]|uniref:hypothetical protein n=1 Tax=Ralstonia pseudosolanacearum TaxID=1310165 RepID=UPI003CF4AED5
MIPLLFGMFGSGLLHQERPIRIACLARQRIRRRRDRRRAPRGMMVSYGNASGPVPPFDLGVLS